MRTSSPIRIDGILTFPPVATSSLAPDDYLLYAEYLASMLPPLDFTILFQEIPTASVMTTSPIVSLIITTVETPTFTTPLPPPQISAVMTVSFILFDSLRRNFDVQKGRYQESRRMLDMAMGMMVAPGQDGVAQMKVEEHRIFGLMSGLATIEDAIRRRLYDLPSSS